MKQNITKKIDVSIPRWMYWSDEVESLHLCPKCKSPLINEHHTYLVAIKEKKEIESFMVGSTGGHFCPNCPIVVLDKAEFESLMAITVRNYRSAQIAVMGLINLDAVPEDKKSVPLGRDDNPIPLVSFLNNEEDSESIEEKEHLNLPPPKKEPPKPVLVKKVGRNEPCPCGSGKKYKKCCGR